MNRDDIIRMAREAKLSHEIGVFGYPYLPELERFAALVAATEREACARVCDDYGDDYGDRDGHGGIGFMCAEAIRARGEK